MFGCTASLLPGLGTTWAQPHSHSIPHRSCFSSTVLCLGILCILWVWLKKHPTKAQIPLFSFGDFGTRHQKPPHPGDFHPFSSAFIRSLFMSHLSLPHPPDENTWPCPPFFVLFLIYNRIFSGNQPIYSLTLIRLLWCSATIQNFIITYRASFYMSKLY